MDIKTKRNNKVDGIARIHEHRNEATTEAMLHTVLTDSRNETTLLKKKKNVRIQIINSFSVCSEFSCELNLERVTGIKLFLIPDLI